MGKYVTEEYNRQHICFNGEYSSFLNIKSYKNFPYEQFCFIFTLKIDQLPNEYLKRQDKISILKLVSERGEKSHILEFYI